MQPAELRYGQKLLIAYTRLDGLESAEVVKAHWLKKDISKDSQEAFIEELFHFHWNQDN